MTVVFKRVSPPGWRWQKSRQRFRWSDSYAHALVDGHTVTVRPSRGWQCSCPDADCVHPDTVAALIDPHLLALLEAERIIPRSERKL